MYTSQPGSAERQLEYLEDWLVTLVQLNKRMAESLERKERSDKSTADPKQDWYIEKLGKRLEGALASQLSSRLNQAQALANRGFSGTVEAARMDYAMEQLGRQFAAVMKPVMDALTYGAVQIEARMRRMSGGDQNALLGMGIGAFAGRMVGGLPGMLAGGLLGSAMMGTPSNERAALAGYGMAAVGGRLGGLPGAIPGLAAGGYFSSRAAEEATSSPTGRLAIASLRRATPMGAMLDSVMGSPRSGPAAAPAATPRRDVTPFQSDMMDAGGTYFAIQKAMIRATAGAEFEEDNPLKPIVDMLLDIVKLLGRLAGVDFAEPASATDARPGGGAAAPALAARPARAPS